MQEKPAQPPPSYPVEPSGIVQQQPQLQQPMQAMQPAEIPNAGQWTESVWKAHGDGKSWYGCCCPCIVFGQVYHHFSAIRKGQIAQDPPCCNVPCLVYLISFHFLIAPCIIQCCVRKEVRARYNIPGNDFKDCCFYAGCATGCDLAQQYRKIEEEEKWLLEHTPS